MKEIWKFYKTTYNNRYGYRQYYVSNLGNVTLNGELCDCLIGTDGCYYLCSIPLHRIVAQRFLHDYDPNLEVDHIDGNPLNNRADNLRMCNHKENCNNPITIKRMSENHYNPNYGGLSEEHKRKISESIKEHYRLKKKINLNI